MDVVVRHAVHISLALGDNCGHGNSDHGVGRAIRQEELIDRAQLGQTLGCNGRWNIPCCRSELSTMLKIF